jgi:hypothetical protein
VPELVFRPKVVVENVKIKRGFYALWRAELGKENAKLSTLTKQLKATTTTKKSCFFMKQPYDEIYL